jgi:MFS family permease
LLSRVRYPWIKLQTLIWFLGFAFLALLVGRQVILLAAIMAILGFTGAMGNIELDTHLMRNFDRDMLARVTSMSRFLSLIACAVGPAFGGTLVQEFGINGAMTFLFVITSALPLLAVIAPAAAGARGHSPHRQEVVAVPDTPVPVGQS